MAESKLSVKPSTDVILHIDRYETSSAQKRILYITKKSLKVRGWGALVRRIGFSSIQCGITDFSHKQLEVEKNG
jgi:hypothetical protein